VCEGLCGFVLKRDSQTALLTHQIFACLLPFSDDTHTHTAHTLFNTYRHTESSAEHLDGSPGSDPGA